MHTIDSAISTVATCFLPVVSLKFKCRGLTALPLKIIYLSSDESSVQCALLQVSARPTAVPTTPMTEPPVKDGVKDDNSCVRSLFHDLGKKWMLLIIFRVRNA